MRVIADLARRWRTDADTFRRYGDERAAEMLEARADELEDALAEASLETVTLEEAAGIGGYSYSHLQALVADEKIHNHGTKGRPRVLRADVPVKPGRGPRRAISKTEILERSIGHRA